MDVKEIDAAVAAIRAQTSLAPRVGIVLGSGLGALTRDLRSKTEIPYGDLPGFPTSTVAGHQGFLALGELSGIPVAVMAGRVHGYEGYTADAVAFPARVLGRLGVQHLVVTNASGAINPLFQPGDIMVIRDQLNLTGQNPLRGPNLDALGPRFPDMSHTFCPAAAEKMHAQAARDGIRLRDGIYAGVAGPSYETPAEVRMLRLLGADAVGMSTVYEVIAAAHMGIPVTGLAVLTNHAAGVQNASLSHAEVTQAAEASAERLIGIISGAIGDLV